jgi:hypothetical protein
VLLVLLSPRSFSERFGAGARPVHPILRHWPRPTAILSMQVSVLSKYSL